MSDTPQTPPPTSVPITVLAQYVKDLSFENPKAPRSIIQSTSAPPKVNINVDVQVRDLADETYEVTLRLIADAVSPEASSADAGTGDGSGASEETVFVAELSYAGLFRLGAVEDRTRRAILLIEAPRLMFPFAREVLASISRQGGFPPLLVNPIDFADLYKRQAASQASQTANPQG